MCLPEKYNDIKRKRISADQITTQHHSPTLEAKRINQNLIPNTQGTRMLRVCKRSNTRRETHQQREKKKLQLKEEGSERRQDTRRPLYHLTADVHGGKCHQWRTCTSCWWWAGGLLLIPQGDFIMIIIIIMIIICTILIYTRQLERGDLGRFIASWSGTAYSVYSQLTSERGLSPIRHLGTRWVGVGCPFPVYLQTQAC